MTYQKKTKRKVQKQRSGTKREKRKSITNWRFMKKKLVKTKLRASKTRW